jgi:hypothetical protein
MKPKSLHLLSVLVPVFFADAAPRCGGSSRPERPLPPPEDTTGGETSGFDHEAPSEGGAVGSASIGVVDRRA